MAYRNTKVNIASIVTKKVDLSQQQRFWNRFWSAASQPFPLGSQPSELMADFVALPAVDTVLEIGVGDGRNLAVLCEKCVRLIGIDLSEAAVRRSEAQRYNKAGIDLIIGSAYAVSVPDNSCDMVVATDVMNHLAWPQEFSGEVWRVLKKGGIFLGNAMSTRDPSRKMVSLKGGLLSSRRSRVRWNIRTNADTAWLNMRYYGKEELKQMFRDFALVTPLAEYFREDAGHPLPFATCAHQHVFWKLHLQKPCGRCTEDK